MQTLLHAIVIRWLGLDVMFLLCGFHAALTLVPTLGDRRRSVKQARNCSRFSNFHGGSYAEPLLLTKVMLVLTPASDAAFVKQMLICVTALLLPEFLASSSH